MIVINIYLAGEAKLDNDKHIMQEKLPKAQRREVPAPPPDFDKVRMKMY